VLGAEGDEDALAGVRVEGGADERIVGGVDVGPAAVSD